MSGGAGSRLDAFTRRRIIRFIEDFRAQSGQLPTLRDLAQGGFPEATVDLALKDGVIERFYVTLTQGSVVKGYKIRQP